MNKPTLDSPWKDVERYLRENGVTYPWNPRDTLKALLERDELLERIEEAKKEINAALRRGQIHYGVANDIKGALSKK